jgi:hypothetical protein
MATNLKTNFIKGRIPDGSRVAISVANADPASSDTFVASARLVLDNGGEEIWDDSMIHPGPKTKKLVSPKGYVWRVFVGFAGKTSQTVIVNCTVFGPDGDVFGETYDHPVSGVNGEEARATIFLLTVKS